MTIPRPFDSARAARTLEAFTEATPDFVLPERASTIFTALFGNSPYLARLATRERIFAQRLANDDLSWAYDATNDGLAP